jgi:hypothetical protein
MSNATEQAHRYSHVTEFWTVETKRGPRAYYWGHRAFRALPIPHAVAELLEATGQAIRTTKPEWVGR